MKAPRNTTVDMARGFTVLIMPAVHSVLYYGSHATRRSWLGKLLGFLAEGPGAQLFMFLMGVSVALGRKKSSQSIIAKATQLMTRGFVLNILRLMIPYTLHFFPDNMLQDAGFYPSKHPLRKMFLTGDILQCAALCYPVTAWIHRLRKPAPVAVWSAIAVILFSKKAWDKPERHFPGSYWLTLCTGRPPAVFFPVLPWLSYALAGLAWGLLLQQQPTKKVYSMTAWVGAALLAMGSILSKYEPLPLKTNFYRLGPGGTLSHLGIVLLWLTFSHLISRKIRWNRFFSLLVRLSKNITRIYTVQWIVVLWLLPFFGYRRSGLLKSIVSMILNTMITICLTQSKNPNHEKNLRLGRNRHRAV